MSYEYKFHGTIAGHDYVVFKSSAESVSDVRATILYLGITPLKDYPPYMLAIIMECFNVSSKTLSFEIVSLSGKYFEIKETIMNVILDAQNLPAEEFNTIHKNVYWIT